MMLDEPVPLTEFELPRRDARPLLRGCRRGTRVFATVWSSGAVTLRWVVGTPGGEERERHIATMSAWWERCSGQHLVQ